MTIYAGDETYDDHVTSDIRPTVGTAKPHPRRMGQEFKPKTPATETHWLYGVRLESKSDTHVAKYILGMERKGTGENITATFPASKTALVVQLRDVMGDAFERLIVNGKGITLPRYRIEVDVTTKRPPDVIAVHFTERHQAIQAVYDHAEEIGLLGPRSGEITDILRKHIIQPNEMDLPGALAAVDALRPVPLFATEPEKSEPRVAPAGYHFSPLTGEVVKDAPPAGDYWPEHDHNVYPFDTTTFGLLAAWFPKDKETETMTDQTTAPAATADNGSKPKHWSASGSFRGWVRDTRAQYAGPHDWTSDEVNAWLHKIFGVKSLTELDFPMATGQKLILEELNGNFEKIAETPAEAPETGDVADDTNEPPVAQPTPIAPSFSPIPQSVLVPMETPFVVLIDLYHPSGAQLRFTVRGNTVAELDQRADELIKRYMSKGYRMTREPAQAAPMAAPASNGSAPAPVPLPASAPASEGGTFQIREIKKTMDEGKTWYQFFEQPGSDRPVIKTQMADQMNSLINVEAMQPGTRYTVNWILTWKPSKTVGRNGQPFKNVASIKAAS